MVAERRGLRLLDDVGDGQAGAFLNAVGDGQGGEHDGQVRFDGLARAVEHRLCRGLDYADDRGTGADQRCGIGCGVGIFIGSQASSGCWVIDVTTSWLRHH
jgi:hypothetical protein